MHAEPSAERLDLLKVKRKTAPRQLRRRSDQHTISGRVEIPLPVAVLSQNIQIFIVVFGQEFALKVFVPHDIGELAAIDPCLASNVFQWPNPHATICIQAANLFFFTDNQFKRLIWIDRQVRQ